MGDAAVGATRVLVVEDDADIVLLIQTMLAVDGYEVHVARDGEEALARAASVRLEVVPLDVRLPGVGGLEVAEALRADVATANVVIVFLTAGADGR